MENDAQWAELMCLESIRVNPEIMSYLLLLLLLSHFSPVQLCVTP